MPAGSGTAETEPDENRKSFESARAPVPKLVNDANENPDANCNLNWSAPLSFPPVKPPRGDPSSRKQEFGTKNVRRRERAGYQIGVNRNRCGILNC